MIAYDKEEVDRRDARNNLEEFVNKARKSGGTLAVISDNRALGHLNAIRNWSDGTKEEYQSALEYWTNYVCTMSFHLPIVIYSGFGIRCRLKLRTQLR